MLPFVFYQFSEDGKHIRPYACSRVDLIIGISFIRLYQCSISLQRRGAFSGALLLLWLLHLTLFSDFVKMQTKTTRVTEAVHRGVPTLTSSPLEFTYGLRVSSL